MTRREFLDRILDGGAVLSPSERALVERQRLERESESRELNWVGSVYHREHLPEDASEADAYYVERMYSSFVCVDGVGWLEMTRISGVVP